MLMPHLRFAALVAFSLAPLASQAAVIVETEAGGTATNNSLATAQTVPASAFTAPSPANVFSYNVGSTASIQGIGGGDDVDFYSFTTSGNTFHFDIDGAGFDTILSLFDSTGTLIGIGDDSFPADPGSASGFESFLGEIALGPGTYFVAVSEFANFPSEFINNLLLDFLALTRPDGVQDGGFAVLGASPDASFLSSGNQPASGSPYTLHITQNPEPASIALWTVLGLAAAARYSRRRRARA